MIPSLTPTRRNALETGQRVVARLKRFTSMELNRPLRIQFVPDELCDAVGSIGGAVAGILLLLSVLFEGRWLGLAVVTGAALALLGRYLPLPAGPTQSIAPIGAGAAIAVFGMFALRR